ncbi:hypothetical protein [Helicobacter pylori]|nr:hypothetical protein [Helicobacter pylori]
MDTQTPPNQIIPIFMSFDKNYALKAIQGSDKWIRKLRQIKLSLFL